jgi:hypothetical protein
MKGLSKRVEVGMKELSKRVGGHEGAEQEGCSGQEMVEPQGHKTAPSLSSRRESELISAERSSFDQSTDHGQRQEATMAKPPSFSTSTGSSSSTHQDESFDESFSETSLSSPTTSTTLSEFSVEDSRADFIFRVLSNFESGKEYGSDTSIDSQGLFSEHSERKVKQAQAPWKHETEETEAKRGSGSWDQLSFKRTEIEGAAPTPTDVYDGTFQLNVDLLSTQHDPTSTQHDLVPTKHDPFPMSGKPLKSMLKKTSAPMKRADSLDLSKMDKASFEALAKQVTTQELPPLPPPVRYHHDGSGSRRLEFKPDIRTPTPTLASERRLSEIHRRRSSILEPLAERSEISDSQVFDRSEMIRPLPLLPRIADRLSPVWRPKPTPKAQTTMVTMELRKPAATSPDPQCRIRFQPAMLEKSPLDKSSVVAKKSRSVHPIDVLSLMATTRKQPPAKPVRRKSLTGRQKGRGRKLSYSARKHEPGQSHVAIVNLPRLSISRHDKAKKNSHDTGQQSAEKARKFPAHKTTVAHAGKTSRATRKTSIVPQQELAQTIRKKSSLPPKDSAAKIRKKQV